MAPRPQEPDRNGPKELERSRGRIQPAPALKVGPSEPLSNDEPRANGIIGVDQPTRRADDVGPALDRRSDGLLLAEHGLAYQAALEHARAKQALLPDRLVETQFAARMQHRHHGRGAG